MPKIIWLCLTLTACSGDRTANGPMYSPEQMRERRLWCLEHGYVWIVGTPQADGIYSCKAKTGHPVF